VERIGRAEKGGRGKTEHLLAGGLNQFFGEG
jgi:hypothetical protein